MFRSVEITLKNPERIRNFLNARPLAPTESSTQLRAAAVLVLLQPETLQTGVWFVLRSLNLRHHPGQIAFPGGKPETPQEDLWATALRESEEEIGVDPARVVPLGPLGLCNTPSGFRIQPFLAWNEGPRPQGWPNSEVEVAFSLPVCQLWQSRQAEQFATPFGPIWGATARILRQCLGLLEKAST